MNDRIFLSNESSIPKYKQIVAAVQTSLEQGRLSAGDRLPSFNQLCHDFNISRDTVIKAYQELKVLGLVSSSPGDGNYIAGSSQQRKRHVFLLFDEFNAYKELLFNRLKTTPAPHGQLDFYFHETKFLDFIKQSHGKYTDYVIMPLSTKESFQIFPKLFQQANIYILDQGGSLYGEAYPFVDQDFEQGIYKSLLSASQCLSNYKRFIMIIDPSENESRYVMTEQMCNGFYQFCKGHMPALMENSICDFKTEKSDCLFVHSDRELYKNY